jgi:predicted membrane-bound spermidine synthase
MNPVHIVPSYLSKTVLLHRLRVNLIHVPNVISLLLSLGRLSKEYVQFRGLIVWKIVFLPWVVSPLSAVRDCLFNIFITTLHIWRMRHALVTRCPFKRWRLFKRLNTNLKLTCAALKASKVSNWPIYNSSKTRLDLIISNMKCTLNSIICTAHISIKSILIYIFVKNLLAKYKFCLR